MARYNLNRNNFSPLVKEKIQKIGFEEQCRNPFRSIIIRALEVLYACDEALRIISAYEGDSLPASIKIKKRSAVGYGATEAPRGLLYHRYHLNEQGLDRKRENRPPHFAESKNN